MDRTTAAFLGALAGGALAYAGRSLAPRVFPYPDVRARLGDPGAPSGALGGPSRAFLPGRETSEGCDAGLVNIQTQGALSSTICVTPAQYATLTSETSRARTLQVLAAVGLVAGGAALGSMLAGRGG